MAGKKNDENNRFSILDDNNANADMGNGSENANSGKIGAPNEDRQIEVQINEEIEKNDAFEEEKNNGNDDEEKRKEIDVFEDLDRGPRGLAPDSLPKS